jgi:pyrrolidone-carboxylate peptidase
MFSIRSNGRVSTKQIRTLHDFSRHRRDIEVTCYCGLKAVLPYREVVTKFSRAGWPITLEIAAGHFRCSKCGSSPRQIGPMER